jgi:hypothetical protein
MMQLALEKLWKQTYHMQELQEFQLLWKRYHQRIQHIQPDKIAEQLTKLKTMVKKKPWMEGRLEYTMLMEQLQG